VAHSSTDIKQKRGLHNSKGNHMLSSMAGFLNGAMALVEYREFLEKQLCWIDGARTHGSHATQRQCSKCRRKWNYRNRLNRLRLLIAYAQQRRAGEAANEVGCSRNTAQVFFREMDKRVAELVKVLRPAGGISIVDEKLTSLDLKRISCNPGKYLAKEAVSRAIFFNGINVERRIELLVELEIFSIAEVIYRIENGKSLAKRIWRNKSSIPRSEWRKIMVENSSAQQWLLPRVSRSRKNSRVSPQVQKFLLQLYLSEDEAVQGKKLRKMARTDPIFKAYMGNFFTPFEIRVLIHRQSLLGLLFVQYRQVNP
jgi:hypothetical protein